MNGLVKAALIGAGATFIFAQIDKAVGISAKVPASVAFIVPFVPGALAGIAAKKWG
jgi:hypothetical protein